MLWPKHNIKYVGCYNNHHSSNTRLSWIQTIGSDTICCDYDCRCRQWKLKMCPFQSRWRLLELIKIKHFGTSPTLLRTQKRESPSPTSPRIAREEGGQSYIYGPKSFILICTSRKHFKLVSNFLISFLLVLGCVWHAILSMIGEGNIICYDLIRYLAQSTYCMIT